LKNPRPLKWINTSEMNKDIKIRVISGYFSLRANGEQKDISREEDLLDAAV
jgi:hypothetical protein